MTRSPAYYHGTSMAAAERIADTGFRETFLHPDGERGRGGGNLGHGVYVSASWRMAMWFGTALLRVSLRPGTRILDATVVPDPNVLRYLEREFGRRILRADPRIVIPENKRLTQRELTALFRHHYRRTWETSYPPDPDWGGTSWPRKRAKHFELLAPYRSLLVRYGYHGYGNDRDDNGIVVFAGDRVVPEELVTAGPMPRAVSADGLPSEGDRPLDRGVPTHLLEPSLSRGSPPGRPHPRESGRVSPAREEAASGIRRS